MNRVSSSLEKEGGTKNLDAVGAALITCISKNLTFLSLWLMLSIYHLVVAELVNEKLLQINFEPSIFIQKIQFIRFKKRERKNR